MALAEEIITALSKVGELFVISRNSSFSYKGKPVKVQQVSEELGVRYVLEGSVRRSGDRVRITAQLIDAIKGQHLWAENYDRDFKDIFEIQDEITMKIVTSLRIKLTEGEQARILDKKIKNPDVYLKASQRYLFGRMAPKKASYGLASWHRKSLIWHLNLRLDTGYWVGITVSLRAEVYHPRRILKRPLSLAKKRSP